MNVKLLKQVKKHILEEPNRFLMRTWVVKRRGRSKYFTVEFSDDRVQFAKCNTAACIGGWTCILGGKPRTKDHYESAKELIGLDTGQAQRLFGVYHWPTDLLNQYQDAGSQEARVKVAAARIDRFIATKGND